MTYKQSFILFTVGVLTLFAQAPFDLFPILCFGYGFFCYHWMQCQTPKQAFWKGYLFGAGYFLGGLYWVGNALLTDISQFYMFLPFAYIGLPMALGLFYAIPAWGAYILTKESPKIWKFLALAIFLAVSDVVRGHIFTGFPWNLPVYSTAFLTLLMQPVYYLSTYGYNLVIITLALSFAFWRKPSVMGVQLIAICLLLGIGKYHISVNKLERVGDKTYRIIQPNIEQKMKWDDSERQNHFNILLKLSEYKINPNKKYVMIWPETSMPFHPEGDKNAYNALETISAGKHDILMGKMRYVPDGIKYKFYNSMFAFMQDKSFLSFYDKIHLVPFGEYLPLAPLLKSIGFNQINHFQSGFERGEGYNLLTLEDGTKIGSQICYEMIFPLYSKLIKKEGADVIITVTNDAWFGTSTGPYQHLSQARFRAVENGIMVIRSANTGVSAFIDPFGRIIKKTRLNTQAFIEGKAYRFTK